MTGPVVLDIVQHFVERWNEIKKRKVCLFVHAYVYLLLITDPWACVVPR